MATTRTAAATGPDVVAAGTVALRKNGDVLLVHRPKYDDWAFPKGKQDPGEHVTVTAVRETLEETGLRVRLGRPLPPQLYAVAGGRAKMVHYWAARCRGSDDVSGFVVNNEIDEVVWLPREKARRMLTYQDDIELLSRLEERENRTTPLVILRHARARKRATWEGADPRRPLTRVGRLQAKALAPVLAAYGVHRVLTSDYARCVETAAPFADEHGRSLDALPLLNEEKAGPRKIGLLLDELMESKQPSLICTHRPVLPLLFDHLGIPTVPLKPGELVVVHHRKGHIVASERHLPR